MYDVLLQMAALIVCGVLWRRWTPGGIAPDTTRKAMGHLVYYLLLPALVLSVLWRAELGAATLSIALLAAFGVFVGALLGWLSCRLCKSSHAVTGAVILAAAFPNATYLGLPVLESTLGAWSRSIAIQYDLFACTPLLMTFGALVGQRYGDQTAREAWYISVLKVPPLWAALVAVLLNVMNVPMPNLLGGWLAMLGQGVSLLMLLSLGMSLRWQPNSWQTLPSVIPVILIQLIIVPLVVWGMGQYSVLNAREMTAVVLEAAMPSMVLGLVFCDRYGLDTTLYATAVTVTTGLSIISLPIWLNILGV